MKLLKKILPFVLLFSLTAFGRYEIKPARNGTSDENAQTLERLSKAVSSISSRAQKAVAFVSVSKTVRGVPAGMINPFDFFFGPGPQQAPQQPREQKQEGLGSGFIIDLDKGYILTNNHVVDEADEIHVKLANGESYEGKVVGRDKNTDVAVIQIKDEKFKTKGLDELTLGNSESVEVGDFVIALGAPFGLEASLSFGIVSAIGRGSLSITELGDFIQTDAAINPGNSGGPLINSAGQVIGINTAIYSRSGGYNGIGFAIPANMVRDVATQLINEGKVLRGYIGARLNPNLDPELARDLKLPEDTRGALIANAEPGGPAHKAGLEPGDVVTAIDGKKVSSDVELRNRVGLIKPGSKVSLEYYRNGKKITTNITVASFDDAAKVAQEKQDAGSFGMRLATVTKELKRQHNISSDYGAVVVEVEENGPAARAGIEPGDVIIWASGMTIKNSADFLKAVAQKTRINLRIEREGQVMFVPLRK